jgi:hypothetical protein
MMTVFQGWCNNVVTDKSVALQQGTKSTFILGATSKLGR